jgi:hypothetical protein
MLATYDQRQGLTRIGLPLDCVAAHLIAGSATRRLDASCENRPPFAAGLVDGRAFALCFHA